MPHFYPGALIFFVGYQSGLNKFLVRTKGLLDQSTSNFKDGFGKVVIFSVCHFYCRIQGVVKSIQIATHLQLGEHAYLLKVLEEILLFELELLIAPSVENGSQEIYFLGAEEGVFEDDIVDLLGGLSN